MDECGDDDDEQTVFKQSDAMVYDLNPRNISSVLLGETAVKVT